MAVSNAECSQWLSVTEETLFLHDGLLRVTDLVELPEGVENCGSKDNEVVSFDTKIPEELSTKLIELCGTRNNAFNTLQEYRLNALKGLWRAQKTLGQDDQLGEREANPQDDAIALLKKQGLIKDSDQASFSTRISLLLILPLLQSQSKTDPELCAVTSGVILTCLKDCPPLSLAKEPSDCLIGLESLLCGWLGEKNNWCTEAKDKKHQENAAAALVALACARGFVKTFVHAVHLLQQQQSIPPLPVGNVLASLLDSDGGQCQVSSFQGSKYILSWGVDDLLGPTVAENTSNADNKENSAEKDKEQDIGRSIASDGSFLYTTNACGKGIAKLGTGRQGTLRGYVYCKNTEIGPGRMAYADKVLLFRPQTFDSENNFEYLAQLIDTNSLQPLKMIVKPSLLSHPGPMTSISFCSDGFYFYWLWCPVLSTDKTAKGINVNVSSFSLEKSLEVVPIQPLVTLHKKDDMTQKGMNEALLSRLRPLRVSNSAATLMALTGTDTIMPSRKEETAPGVGSTSCGIVLKTLVKTPIYCDGNHLVMLTQPPGATTGPAARSLFGGGGSMPGMRALASNLCFNLKTGFFTARVDLVDALSSSVGRGTPPTCLGCCFDVSNNVVWMSSGEYVDLFHNPGNLAPHHVQRRLGICDSVTSEDLKATMLVPINTVITVLLQNVGSMCLHQMTGELYPLISCLGGGGEATANQSPLDFEHLNRVMDILARAVSDQDGQAVICCLVVLQLIFRSSNYKGNDEDNNQHIRNARSLIFKLLTDEPLSKVDGKLRSLVKVEACCVITVGLRSLYSSFGDRQRLLYDLLTSGKDNPSLIELRNSILTDFADQLNRQQAELTDIGLLQLSDELVSFVLKLSVKESCLLLKEVQHYSKEELQDRLSNLPVLSPAVLYLAALRSYLFRCAILHQATDKDNEQIQNLTAIQDHVLSLVSKMIEGACQVLESFLEVCVTVLNSCVNGDLENWLAAFERLAKSTVLGTLMPVLITALTHPNLQCLAIAQALMPALVRLSLLSSRSVLLMKSEELEANAQPPCENEIDLSADKEMADMIGDVLSCDPESNADEEEGFLTGLKIPAPWASGKTVETIHPVRDNYKFKETVHIPGARCLYLRFDPRCSSQYDYDKVVIYAGPSVNGKKVVEYGGNSFGYGSRSVLGSGWPKDLVKVDGDTVTLTFEMRSGREHNTPDKAMWGFACTIRAQESAEEESPGLPFLSDLALGLSVLLSTYLGRLYHGSSQTQDEIDCHHLLKSRLLQRCLWTFEKVHDKNKGMDATGSPVMPAGGKRKNTETSNSGDKETTSSMLAHIKLPKEIMVKLRKLTRLPALQVKRSIKSVLQLDVIEERTVSAIAKHLGLAHSVCHLGKLLEQQGEELAALKAIMEETYRKFDILTRQLQMMAHFEKMWQMDLEDRKDDQESSQQEPPFFHDYHLRENSHRDLSTIAFLKDIAMETDTETVVNNLLEKYNRELEELKSSKSSDKSDELNFAKTKQVVSGILSRLDLLLHVNSIPMDAQSALTRTLSYTQGFKEDLMVRSDTDVSFSQLGFGRSMSAPVGIDESAIFKQHRWRQMEKQRRMASILQDLVDDGDEDKPPHIIVIDQLFAFIGNDPLKTVSSTKFLKAAEERHKRGCSRKEALNHIKELLSSAAKIGGATHLVAAVSSVLRHGPKVEDLVCGGMVTEVRDAFAEAMSSVVQLAARYPIHSASSIGLLCTIPYTRAEEKCLVRSGLVHLLDNLCGLGSHRVSGMHAEMQTPGQKVSALAWAGFQVLASRCVKWEVEDGSQVEQLEHSGLAKQVSMLLTHHLARATEGIGNAMAGTEALQEVLSLLNNLSRSRMGKAILSQPACVSKLLSLLLDQRPSPKLVLIILQLCRVSLPLMNCDDCQEVELPTWGQQLGSTHWSSSQPISDPPARIISLLLAKLGDFLVPGDQVLLSSRSSSQEVVMSGRSTKLGDVEKEDSDVQRGRLSVFVHKRNDQTSHDVIQPLLNQENRPFRLVGSASVDKVVRLDREISKNGKAELTTEEAVSAFRKAYKWAQLGLVISIAPPSDAAPIDNSGTDKKKAAAEVICKEKNSELLRTDPIRAFISGHVANAMATEVIALLHNLLFTHVSSSARTWSQAVQRVLANALSGLPMLLSSVEGQGLSSPRNQSNVQLMTVAKLANAALCALGGFQETIKPGCEVKVMGEGIAGTRGTVLSVSEQNDVVTIQLEDKRDSSAEEKDYSPPPTYSDTIKVPISRVRPIRNDMFIQYQSDMGDALLSTVKSVILPCDETTSPLAQQLYSLGDGNSMANQISRVMAEIRTRTSLVLTQYLQDIEFAKKFIDHCGYSIDMLKSIAKECNTGSRLPVLESHCQRLRMLYRDCAKPPAPPCRTDIRPTKEMMWDVVRPCPPTRACMFSHGMTGVMFLGDPSAGIGLPRGTMVYANQAIPKEAPSFYWELEIISFGDAQAESGAVVSFGFAPPAEKKDGAWTNPVGTCLFLNTGKAVHYNGASLLQWRSVRLDIVLNAGDVAGIGWERTGDAADSTQVPKGQVYFTHNGQRLSASLDSVSGAMYPVVHIQKKNCRVKANFGTRPFAFAEGQQHRDAAEAASDVLKDIRESFGHLPFHSTSDSESDTPENTQAVTPSESSRDSKSPPKTVCKQAEPPVTLKEYNTEASQNYKLLPSHDNFILTGPDSLFSCPVEEDSDEETVVDEAGSEDHYALLVKAWEQKVFPVIRRRFRNEAERKDGLEQIRGALQLGMTDIARQTVEFLYEENGGIPRDLHLPTIDDIKEDLAKFTIDRVKKGTTVNIRTPLGSSSCNATTQLPKFAVRSMLRTFGLTGTVLDVDSTNELVQVETYLRSEGVLVRFWYPLVMLEKPVQGMRKASITGGQTMDTSNILIHRELLSSEASLARMYLRSAFLCLTDHCNSPAMDVASCSSSLGSGMAVCAATLQELDLENIQLLSEHLLASPYTTGTLEAQSPFQTPSLSQLLATQQVSLTDLVYRDPLRLKRELATAIARASDQGEDYLIELTNQLCMCLQTAPETFPFLSFPVNETKVSTDVHFPGAACILVSCIKSPDGGSKETPPYRAPWARLSTYTGKRIKRCGQVTKQNVVCFPRDVHSQSNGSDQYAPAIIPGDRLFVKIGVSPPPGVTVTLHALPPQFLVAIAYIETLVTETFGCGMQACGVKADSSSRTTSLGEDKTAFRATTPNFISPPLSSDEISNPSLWSLDNISITPVVYLHLLEFLCGYLWKTNVPALLKEYMFHLLAQTIRILHYSEKSDTSYLMKPESRFSPMQGMLNSLHRELKSLFELEMKTMPKMVTSAGTGMGLGVTDSGRFSTYFHALMEVCLAIYELVPMETTGDKDAGEALTEENAAAAGSSTDLASGSLSSGKKKRLKAKKERTAAATSSRRSSSDQRAGIENVDTDGTLTSSALMLSSQADEPSSQVSVVLSSGSTPVFRNASSGYVVSDHSISTVSIKTDDMAWFSKALSISKLLRFLALKESHCNIEMKNAISSAANCLSSPTAHSRLVVITGIPLYLDLATVKKSIRKVCNSLGGLDRDEIFVPSAKTKRFSSSDVESVSLPSSKSLTDTGSLDVQQTTAKDFSQSDPSMDMSQPETSATQSDQVSGSSTLPKTKSKLMEGNAVINLSSKTKVELVKRAFLKTKWLNLNSVDDPDSPEAPDENLNVHIVNQALLTEPEANATLESYLRYKLSGGGNNSDSDITTGVGKADVGNEMTGIIGKEANQVLTEIFYSCYFVDQQQDSGDICLSHEQILNLASENLLAVFFNNVRPSKKPLPEAVMSVLRQYGCQRSGGDKQRSPTSSDKISKGKGAKKTSVRSHKEKQVLGMVEEKGQEEKQQPEEVEKKKGREEKREQEKEEKSPKDSGRKEGATADLPVKESKSLSKMESRLLTLDGFMQYCEDLASHDLRAVWKGLFACGLDLHLERCSCSDLNAAFQMMLDWTLERDTALVHYVNELCGQLAVSSSRLHPHEIRLSEAYLTNEMYCSLQGLPPESIRLRFAFLQTLNNSLESFFLPLVDLRPGHIYSRSTSYVLSQLRSLIFYDAKVNFFNRILNASAKRKADQAAPEITLNPIEAIGTGEKEILSSVLCQSYRQLSTVNSKNFCVRLASGGDPTYSFNVRMTGEEVHGNSGSFRHFLWQVARELQSTSTGLLIPGPNKGRWLIMPGQMTFSEENLLLFLGQLLGITIRADIPFGLDLLPTVWKLLVGMTLDPTFDLKQADPATYGYIKRIEMAETESELESIVGDGDTSSLFPSLTGCDINIMPGTSLSPIRWSQRQMYMDAIKELRMRELTCAWRMQAVCAGMSSLIPHQVLSLLSPWDLEMRTSGRTFISLDFLKAHTMYQVGLVESDPHIEYFWSALESLSQEDLARFVKFACNQERIPQMCPCQEGGLDSAHVPPYPMKIAPPDGSGPPDSRYIRVETCMFMVKLPQYSSYEVMLQRLLYAINCREDPLSG